MIRKAAINKKTVFFFFILFLLSGIPLTEAASNTGLKSIISQKIKTQLKNTIYKNVNVGIQIYDIGTKEDIYSQDTARPYIPASAVKVIPSAVALIKFKPEYRFKTPIKTDGNISNDELKGNIYLIGKADPSLMISDLAGAVQQLKEKGIHSIQGNIIYDISFLDEEKNRFAPNARNLYAPPCALTVNYSWLDVIIREKPSVKLTLNPDTAYARLDYNVKISASLSPGRPELSYTSYEWGDKYLIKGSITRWDKQYHYVWLGASRPGLFAATLFREVCEKNGIIVKGKIMQGRTPEKAELLTEMVSRPLKETIKEMNQASNNIIAETINKALGAYFKSCPGTREKGLQVIREFCTKEIGLSPEQFILADASGLSPKNKVSVSGFITALNYFYQDKEIRDAFIPTLAPQGHHPHALYPVPPDNIKIYVKTGTLSVSGVNTTVGYIILEEKKQAFAFAILANRAQPGPMTYSGTLTNPLLSVIVDGLKEYLKQ